MRIATWNVNSINARLERLMAWLEKWRPHVLCLQELKVTDDAFPYDEIAKAGYHAAVYGQKAYNGVAILSREPLEDIRRGFGDDDPQARLIAAKTFGLRLICAYVPNGGEVGTDRYAYKLQWLSRFQEFLREALQGEKPLIVCGDFNIVPAEIDCHDPTVWEGSVLYNPELREIFRQILGLGLVDLFRLKHPEAREYSWWDYRNLAFPKNEGLRIDFLLCPPEMATKCTEVLMDRSERKGKRPSDHVPVVADFED